MCLYIRKCLTLGIIVFATFFSLSIAVLGADCYDTFTRGDSNLAGSTEAVTAFRWFEVNDNSSNNLITIDANRLYMHYFRSTPNSVSLGCNIGGLNSDYADVSAVFAPYSATYGFAYGIGYRLAAQNSKYLSAGGYYVKLNTSITPNTATLLYGSAQVASADVTIPPGDSTLRVIADGASHKVYLNGALVIDVTHTGKTSAGYVGVFAYYSIVRVDDLSVKISSAGPEISDNFNRTNSNAPGALQVSKFSWNEVGDVEGNRISISGNSLYFHYFNGGGVSRPNLACNLNNFNSANVDISVALTPYSNSYGQYYGVGYRLASADSLYKSAGGYYLQLNKAANTMTLWYGASQIATAGVAIPDGASTLRVVAEGTHHRAWLNGGIIIDVYDSNKTSGGNAGIFDYYSIIHADNFTAQSFPSPAPAGNDFPLIVYAINDVGFINAEKKFGWNMAMGYGDTLANLSRCESGGLRACVALPLPIPVGDPPTSWIPPTETEITDIIDAAAPNPYTGWWYMAEEMSYWKTGKYATFTAESSLSRTNDPQQRPRFSYLAGNYTRNDYQYYISYLDGIPASGYATYYAMPHVWVRTRVEEILAGITQAGATTGNNYLNGEKTPVVDCQLYSTTGGAVLTPDGAYHDFWQSIASGARGITIYSYAYKDLSQLSGCWDMYCKAASEIAGPEQLGKVILEGTPAAGVGFTITSGPALTPPTPLANPYGSTLTSVQYSSLNLLAKTWNSRKYLIVVNSSEEATPVGATITGLTGATIAHVLFEGRDITVNGGSFTDSWNPLGVHIYKIE